MICCYAHAGDPDDEFFTMKCAPSKSCSPLVTVLVLNWNGADDTISCLASLSQTDYDNYRVIVVDNGSTDESATKILAAFPEISLVTTGRNLGYAGGNNVGIRKALAEGARYIWILNNDTVVFPDCLRRMVLAAEADEAIGMVGSKIRYTEAPNTIWYAGGTIDLECGKTWHTGKDETDDGRFDMEGPTDFITGCSVLAKREMIEAIGLPEEKYFLYFEDVDWSLRARNEGWTLWFEPKAVLLHTEGARSTARYSDRFIYYTLRNRLFFKKRFSPDRMRSCHLLQFKSALYFAKTALGGGWRQLFRVMQLAFKAYTDFYLHGRMGQKML